MKIHDLIIHICPNISKSIGVMYRGMYRGRHWAFLSGLRQLSVITGYPYGGVPLRPASGVISPLFAASASARARVRMFVCPNVSGRVSSVRRRVFGNIFATLLSRIRRICRCFPHVRNPSKLFIRF
jgi:hypothetical protein